MKPVFIPNFLAGEGIRILPGEAMKLLAVGLFQGDVIQIRAFGLVPAHIDIAQHRHGIVGRPEIVHRLFRRRIPVVDHVNFVRDVLAVQTDEEPVAFDFFRREGEGDAVMLGPVALPSLLIPFIGLGGILRVAGVEFIHIFSFELQHIVILAAVSAVLQFGVLNAQLEGRLPIGQRRAREYQGEHKAQSQAQAHQLQSMLHGCSSISRPFPDRNNIIVSSESLNIIGYRYWSGSSSRRRRPPRGSPRHRAW